MLIDKVTEILPLPILIGFSALFMLGWFIAPEMTYRHGKRTAVPDCVSGQQAKEQGFSPEALQREIARQILGAASEYFGGNQAGQLAGEVARGLGSKASRYAADERCTCLLLAAAYDSQVRFDATVWLLTLRLVESSGVSGLAGHMSRKLREGHCQPESTP